MRLPRSVARLGLRLRPHVPEVVWDLALELGSLVTDGPAIGLTAAERVLVLAPHPDDETIGCGGTASLLAAAGASVAVVVATDGEATIGARLRRSEIGRRRRVETIAACAELGLPGVPAFLGLPDGDLLAHLDTLTSRLREAVDDVAPDLVLAPWPLERHPDHRAVAFALAGIETREDLTVWGYEAHTPVHATRLVPLDPTTVERKRRALRQHVTAAEAFELEATMALDRWRSLATTAGRGHTEAFLELSGADARALAERVRHHDRR